MKIKKIFAGAIMALSAMTANADIISLDFENIASYPNSNDVFIEDFYNGGTSSIGTSGTDYGISFSDNSLLICLNSDTVFCSNASRGGLAPDSAEGALFFLSGVESIMNVAAGFMDGFSFNYVSVNNPGSVSVFDGLNGTGNLLATINLSANAGSCSGYAADFCPFSAVGVDFLGTAMSVSFAGVANQIAFDDITFGSSTPGTPPSVGVPAPASLGLMALALLGIRLRKGQK